MHVASAAARMPRGKKIQLGKGDTLARPKTGPFAKNSPWLELGMKKRAEEQETKLVTPEWAKDPSLLPKRPPGKT